MLVGTVMNNKNIKFLSNFNILASFITIFIQFYILIYNNIGYQRTIFLLLFSLLTIIALFGQKKYFTPSFLFSSFLAIISLRLANLSNLNFIFYLYLFIICIQFIIFILYCQEKLKKLKDTTLLKEKIMLFQLVFIRIYVGYDLIPHFCEKLFAGNVVRNIDVLAFTSLGVPQPLFFVYFAGIIEFLGSLAFSCGIFLRLSSAGLALYLLIATFLGHHFSLGFIWANRGGGWEFPVLWCVIILSFTVIKPMLFTIDEYILKNFKLPKFLKRIIEF